MEAPAAFASPRDIPTQFYAVSVVPSMLQMGRAGELFKLKWLRFKFTRTGLRPACFYFSFLVYFQELFIMYFFRGRGMAKQNEERLG